MRLITHLSIAFLLASLTAACVPIRQFDDDCNDEDCAEAERCVADDEGNTSCEPDDPGIFEDTTPDRTAPRNTTPEPEPAPAPEPEPAPDPEAEPVGPEPMGFAFDRFQINRPAVPAPLLTDMIEAGLDARNPLLLNIADFELPYTPTNVSVRLGAGERVGDDYIFLDDGGEAAQWYRRARLTADHIAAQEVTAPMDTLPLGIGVPIGEDEADGLFFIPLRPTRVEAAVSPGMVDLHDGILEGYVRIDDAAALVIFHSSAGPVTLANVLGLNNADLDLDGDLEPDAWVFEVQFEATRVDILK